MSLYHDSLDAISRAEAARRAGDLATAADEYAEAARLQREMVERLPPEQVFTRIVFTRSYRTLAGRSRRCRGLARLRDNHPGLTGETRRARCRTD